MNRPRRRKLALNGLGVAIIAGWLAYAAVFFARIHQEPTRVITAAVQRAVADEVREEWMTISHRGQPAGYSHYYLRPQEHGFAVSEELLVRLEILGQKQTVLSRLQADLGADYSLASFNFRLFAGPVSFRLSGRVEGDSLNLVTWMAGQRRVERVPLAGPIYVGAGLRSFIANHELRVGDSFQLAVFDPASLSQAPVVVRVEAKEKIPVNGRPVEAFRLASRFQGVELTTWVSPFGEVLRERGLLGLTLERADSKDIEEIVTGDATVDLVQEAAVTPRGPTLPAPRTTELLELRLGGVDPEGWDLDGGRQEWRRPILTIRKKTPGRLAVSDRPPGELAPYLRPTFLVQSDAPEILDTARNIVAGARDRRQAVEFLCSWVYEALAKRPTLSVPSALEVMRTRAGDCNEHSVLFAALARAADIPTKVVAGLLYDDQRFFYHAWNEVFLGEWVAVDAVLNQVPADATHVRLVVGELDRQALLARALGRLQLEVLAWQ